MKTNLRGILTLFLAFVVQLSFAQEKTVTGKVTDADGLPIPGANIQVKGTDQGTQTDFDGNFSLEVSSDQTLVFTYLGYEKQEIPVGNQTEINVTMEQGAEALDEVVVTAYGNTTKKLSSQSSITISSETIEDRALTTPLQTLQGQIPGLNISTLSGQPGANSTMILRGISSINGNVEPLIILDGVPIDEDNLRGINQNNIKSVSVLKDAAATSLYGNRGSNGVIIINTKSSEYNQDLKVQYSAQYGSSTLPSLNLDLMNSRQKLELQRSVGQGPGANLTDSEITAISNQVNTEWTEYLFREGITQQHNIDFSTGSKNTKSFTSIGYLEQEGTFIASDLQRFNLRTNFEGKSNDDKFTYGSNLTASFSKVNFDEAATTQSRSTFFNPFFQALQGSPLVSPFDPDGSVTTGADIAPGDAAAITGGNISLQPIVLLNSANLNTNRDEEIKIVGNLDANYNFLDNFRAGVRFGMDLETIKNIDLLNPESILGPFQTDPRADFGGLESNSYSRDFNFNGLVSLAYSKTIDDKHTINASIYSEYIKNHLNGINFTAFGLDPRTLGSGASFIAGDTTEDLDGDGTNENPYIDTIGKTNLETGLFSYFATADYDYNNKYGFSASFRRDASVRFSEEERWGTFGSVSGRWNIDQEEFLEDTAFNLLKLRVSYGTTGNQRITGGRYGGLDLFRNTYTVTAGYNGATALVPSNIANRSLTWETTEQINLGFDFGLWKNKLQGNIDFYRNTTEDLFQSRQISLVNATSSINDNIGSLLNEGVELYLDYTIYNDKDWNVNFSTNFSYNRNEIEELAGADEDGVLRTGGATSLAEGEPIGSFFVVRYAGVNPANGNPLFYDADGNLTENLDPENDRVFVDKQRFPIWQGGFTTKIAWKNFDLSTQWSWFSDVHVNNLDLADLESNANIEGSNSAASLLRAWEQPGDITDIPRINGPIGTVTMLNQTDRFIEDASYLRMRNITLGYRFDRKQLEGLGVDSLRLYLQGTNLVTFHGFRGFDPENGFDGTSSSQFPSPVITTFGLNLNF